MVWYCGKECQRRHWKTGGHKDECKRLCVYSALWVTRVGVDDAMLELATGTRVNPVHKVLEKAFHAWLMHERRSTTHLAIEHQAGDSARLLRRLSSDPTFDPNRKIQLPAIQAQPRHPLYSVAVLDGEWGTEAACALLSTRGIDVLLPSGEDDYTVLESFVGSRRCMLNGIDPLDALVVQVTPQEALTRAPLYNKRVLQADSAMPVELRPHKCSMIASVLDWYVCCGGNALDSVVHAFGVDSNGMDLDSTCVVCTRNACTPKARTVSAAGQARRREVEVILDQLRVAARGYKTELPLLLKRLFDEWCPGASNAVRLLTAGYMRYDAPQGVSWLTPRAPPSDTSTPDAVSA